MPESGYNKSIFLITKKIAIVKQQIEVSKLSKI